MKNHELAKIVKQVQMNKEAHFELLFSNIYKTVYYISFKLLGSEVEAEDTAQDIILYIYNHIEELKVPEGFNKWMNRIIYGQCANRIKKISNTRENDMTEQYNENTKEKWDINPEKIVQTKEKNEIVLQIIDELPIKQKEVVLMYYFQQLTTPEIARVLYCSLPSVQNRLFKAKKAIKAKVESSKNFSSYKLFSIGSIPLLIGILQKEAGKIANKKVGKKLILQFEKHKNQAIISKMNLDNKTNKSWYYISRISFIIILLIGAISIVVIMNNSENNEKEESKTYYKNEKLSSLINIPIEKRIVKNKTAYLEDCKISIIQRIQDNSKEEIKMNSSNDQGESLMLEKPETVEKDNNEMLLQEEQSVSLIVETLDTISENDNDSQVVYQEIKVEGQTPQDNQPQKTWYISESNLSTYGKRIWADDTLEQIFTNEANLEDKELAQIKNSETIYHKTVSPVISYELNATVENSKIIYYIQLENTGEVAANNVIIKNIIPQHTELKEILNIKQNDLIMIDSSYIQEENSIFWLIHKLEPMEMVTVAFQVEITDHLHLMEIENNAYIKTLGHTQSLDERVMDIKGYKESNKIVYVISARQENISKTSDNTGKSEIYAMMAFSALSFITYIQSKKIKEKKSGGKQ